MKRSIAMIAAGIVLAGVTAHAEGTPPQPTLKVSPDATAVGTGQLDTRGRATRAKVRRGWNTIHASECGAANVLGVPTMVMASAAYDELDVVLTAGSANPTIQGTMATQCAAGNWTAFYVTAISGRTFSWSALATFDFH